MQTETIEITSSCKIEAMTYERIDGSKPPSMVTLEYVEHSSDHWHSDMQTCIDIDKELAQKMVNFLCKHFEIKPEEIK